MISAAAMGLSDASRTLANKRCARRAGVGGARPFLRRTMKSRRLKLSADMSMGLGLFSPSWSRISFWAGGLIAPGFEADVEDWFGALLRVGRAKTTVAAWAPAAIAASWYFCSPTRRRRRRPCRRGRPLAAAAKASGGLGKGRWCDRRRCRRGWRLGSFSGSAVARSGRTAPGDRRGFGGSWVSFRGMGGTRRRRFRGGGVAEELKPNQNQKPEENPKRSIRRPPPRPLPRSNRGRGKCSATPALARSTRGGGMRYIFRTMTIFKRRRDADLVCWGVHDPAVAAGAWADEFRLRWRFTSGRGVQRRVCVGALGFARLDIEACDNPLADHSHHCTGPSACENDPAAWLCEVMTGRERREAPPAPTHTRRCTPRPDVNLQRRRKIQSAMPRRDSRIMHSPSETKSPCAPVFGRIVHSAKKMYAFSLPCTPGEGRGGAAFPPPGTPGEGPGGGLRDLIVRIFLLVSDFWFWVSAPLQLPLPNRLLPSPPSRGGNPHEPPNPSPVSWRCSSRPSQPPSR